MSDGGHNQVRLTTRLPFSFTFLSIETEFLILQMVSQFVTTMHVLKRPGYIHTKGFNDAAAVKDTGPGEERGIFDKRSIGPVVLCVTTARSRNFR